MSTSSAFRGDTLARLAQHYPTQPVRIAHALADHRLFALDALGAAARRLDPQLVETKRTAHVGSAPVDVTRDGSIETFIRDVADTRAWTMLRFVDRLPEYRALLSDVLDQVAAVVPHMGGAPRTMRAFVFVSSPGTITPFHVDPEYNLLLHLAGAKRLTVFPPDSCLPDSANEALHRAGDNLLDWRDDYDASGMRFDLAPGEGVFVPYKCPHHVLVGDTPAISVSMTWQTPWSEAQGPLHRLNGRLAGVGLPRYRVPPCPRVPSTALFAARVIDRLARS